VSRWLLMLGCALPLCLAEAARADDPPTPSVILVVTAARLVAKPHRHVPRQHVATPKPDCEARGPTSAYSPTSGVALEGRIDKVRFLSDRTVLFLRDGTGETCAFLPRRAELERRGIPEALLRRRTPVAIEGFANRSDTRKVLVVDMMAHPHR